MDGNAGKKIETLSKYHNLKFKITETIFTLFLTVFTVKIIHYECYAYVQLYEWQY